MLRLLVLLAALAALSLAASAQAQTFTECADFSPPSVAEACDRAVPIECRGPDAPQDFDQCLRDNGTTPEAVRGAIFAAMRAAGIPTGGVDTGLGGLAAEQGARAGGPPVALIGLGAGAAVLLLAGAARTWRRARGA